MAISLTCDCGRKLNVKDELDGKRIKCPTCKASLLVEADTGDDDNEEEDEDEDEAPKKKKRSGKDSEKKSGGGKTIFVVLGLGVVLLGCCCLGGSGVGGWYFFLGGVSSPLEAKIVGKWTADVPPPKKGAMPSPEDMMKMAMGGVIEFKADKTVIDMTPMTPITAGKWKTVAAKDDVITVELTQFPFSKKLDIKVVSNDSIKITPADTKTEFAFKRAQ